MNIIHLQHVRATTYSGVWQSQDYSGLKRMRQESTSTNMILVQGLPDDRIQEAE